MASVSVSVSASTPTSRRPARRSSNLLARLVFVVSTLAVCAFVSAALRQLGSPDASVPAEAVASSRDLLFSQDDFSTIADLPADRRQATTTGSGSPAPPPNSSSPQDYPPELFDEDQKRNGAIVLYVFGVLYMFVGLAIVCDEFFVPALEKLSSFAGVSDDVAGATMMAAGGSAPELFTSLFAAYIKSTVGIGTIVGSAVFNVLFVIAMCGLFAKKTLQLTWFPLARDCTFYVIDLGVLALFFADQKIEWWEALCLLILYAMYVSFMSINPRFERWARHMARSGAREKKAFFHVGVLEVMLARVNFPDIGNNSDESEDTESSLGEPPDDGSEEPLSLLPPDKDAPLRAKITYGLTLPLMAVLFVCIPDVRRGGCWEKLFAVAFLGSIFWIGVFSYLMVWWADVIGQVAGIPPFVMGLTFLAAGTSVPDLLTSVIVARQGFGDMAVSSSIGSNIFDITVGLPLPWLIFSLARQEPIAVVSNSLVTSILVLVGMLVAVIVSIACCSWKLNKKLGVTMIVLYVIFLTQAVVVEFVGQA